MLKAYKFRIYPNNEQKEYLNKTFGCVRFIYNKMLVDKIEYYKENEKIIKMIRGGLDNNFTKKDASVLLSQISQEQLLELLKRLDEQKK